MIFSQLNSTLRGRRRGFTLTELLVTIAVFSILAGILLVGLNGAAQSVQKTRTRAIIKKLNLLVMEKWNTYQTRRPPSTPRQATQSFQGGMQPRGMRDNRAFERLKAIRALQRLEMPQSFSDIPSPGVDPQSALAEMGLAGVLPQLPALSRIYQRKLAEALASAESMDDLTRYQSAECLYLIVMYGVIDADGGRKRFGENDVGDTDGDGLKEFLDAWDNPISFLRWAPGFSNDWPEVSECSDLIRLDEPDPFDLMQVERRGAHRGAARETFALFPVIYSYGPDGFSGIASGFIDQDTGKSEPRNSPILNDPFGEVGGALLGAPTPSSQEHEDNVHNHQPETR